MLILRLCLFTGVALWMFWQPIMEQVTTVLSSSSTWCLHGPMHDTWLETSRFMCHTGSLDSARYQDSWDSLLWAVYGSIISGLDTVKTFGNDISYHVSGTIHSISPAQQMLWLVIFGTAMFVPSAAVLALKVLTLPILYLMRWVVQVLVAPFVAMAHGAVGIYTVVAEAVDYIVDLPSFLKNWLQGTLAKETILPGRTIIEVSISEKMDEILRYMRKEKRFYESKQNDSEFVQTNSWPKGLVVVRNSAGQTLGMGFIKAIEGTHVLVTAAHLAMKARHGMILSAGVHTMKHIMLDNPKILVRTELDVAIIEVPVNTMSVLGVGKVKMDKTCSEGAAIKAYGYVDGKFVESLGLMGKPVVHFGFKHECSTLTGWSGTPLYKDGVIIGIHSRSNGIGTNFGLSLDMMLTRLESNDYDGRRHMREMEEWDDEFDGDVISWQWESKQAKRLQALKTGWAEDDLEVETKAGRGGDSGGDLESGFRGVALGDYRWSDDRPMDYDDLPVFESVNFRLAPSGGGNNTSNGTTTPKKQEETMSVESGDSTSSIPEEKVTPASPRKKKSRKSKRSKTGNGQTEESKPSGQVSGNTQPASEQASGSQEKKQENGSKPKSWTQAYTQELLRQIGTGVGEEEAVKLAKEFAKTAFPKPSPVTTSQESGQ
jgi:hypothetical protein